MWARARVSASAGSSDDRPRLRGTASSSIADAPASAAASAVAASARRSENARQRSRLIPPSANSTRQRPSSQSVMPCRTRRAAAHAGARVPVDRLPVTGGPRPGVDRTEAGQLHRGHAHGDARLDVGPGDQVGTVGARRASTDEVAGGQPRLRAMVTPSARAEPRSHTPSRAVRRATSRLMTRAVTWRSDHPGSVSTSSATGSTSRPIPSDELGGDEPATRRIASVTTSAPSRPSRTR